MKYELHAIKSVVGRGEIMTRLGDICEKSEAVQLRMEEKRHIA